jgi:hypothetical protein
VSDISEAVVQDQIAESILSAPIVGDHRLGALAESGEAAEQAQPEQPTNNERLADLSTDRERPEDLVENSVRLTREEASEITQQRQPENNAQQQAIPQEATPQQVRETVEGLDKFISQHDLSDDLRTKEFSLALAELGQPLETINQGELGKGLDRLVLSGLLTAETQPGLDFPEISRAAAAELCFSVLPALGVDPRDPNINQQYFAGILHAASVNFHRTAAQLGTDDVRRLNDPQVIDRVFWALCDSCGHKVEWPLSPQTHEVAMRLADAFGKLHLSYRARVTQNYHPQQSEQKPARRSGSRSQGFRTNRDIFDNPTLERLDLEKATYKRNEDFAPKQRAQQVPWTSNRDLYDSETMEQFRRL